MKPDATLELTAFGRQEDPLLASWRYKKGKTAAFTSDVSGRWSYHWVGWPSFYTFWTDLVDSVRPEGGAQLERVRFELRYFVEKGALTLDLSVYSEGADGAAAGELQLPDGGRREVRFQTLARGHHQAVIENITAGKYELRAQVGERKLTPVAFALSGELFGEKKGEGFARPVLEKIAAATGGSLNPAPEQLLESRTPVSERTDLSALCAGLALLLLCLEIAYRELWAGRRRSRQRGIRFKLFK